MKNPILAPDPPDCPQTSAMHVMNLKAVTLQIADSPFEMVDKIHWGDFLLDQIVFSSTRIKREKKTYRNEI